MTSMVEMALCLYIGNNIKTVSGIVLNFLLMICASGRGDREGIEKNL